MNLEEGNKLSRVWQIASSDDRVFGIITAFRGEYGREENLQRNAQLASDLRNAGMGFFVMDGYWVENPGTPNEEHVGEDSYFVSAPVGSKAAATFSRTLLGLMKKYEQEAVIVQNDPHEEVYLLFPDGSKESIGSFNPNKVAQAYSRLRDRGQTFVFESARTPMNFGRALANKLLRETAAS